MLSLPLLLGVIAAGAFAWFWQTSLGARERANRAALEACERMQLQFLDGTVAFARLGLTRGDAGRIALRRTYVFDYTATSIERRQGFVVLVGNRVESIGFESEPKQREQPLAAPPSTPPDGIDPSQSNVLDLAEWRKRRRSQPKLPAERSRSSNDNSPSDSGW